MRKIFMICALLVLSTGAWAQNMYDALTFSESNYYGTARSMALGNAMTALGGDLGSISLNPAGSAVSPYSQFTISPGFSISAMGSSYAPVAGLDFTTSDNSRVSRANMPNIGVICNFDTYRKFGLKSMSVGVVLNTSNNYLSNFKVSGINEHSTMLGAIAASATDAGWLGSVLGNEKAYWETGPDAPSWNAIAAYQSNMIATIDADGKEYIGSTETIFSDGSIGLAGPIRQSAHKSVIGVSNDVVFNYGMNFNDNLFLGVNIGMPFTSYDAAESFTEEAVDKSDFFIDYGGGASTCFESADYNYHYRADMDGVYAKVGVIWLPISGLRLGAAIKTPTAMTIREKWYVESASRYIDSYYDGDAYTPANEYKYYLRTPYEANFGVAYTYGSLGLISLGWDLTDYSSMKFRDFDDYYYGSDSFRDVNNDIKSYCGVVNTIRAGVELRALSFLMLRAGYTYRDCPEFYSEYGVKKRYEDNTKAWSLGLGYSSYKAFFADLAFRSTRFADSSYYPYDDYLSDGFPSAEIRNTRKMNDLVLTLGWRF